MAYIFFSLLLIRFTNLIDYVIDAKNMGIFKPFFVFGKDASASICANLIYEFSHSFFGISASEINAYAQIMNPVANVESILIDYNGCKVRAKRLTVHSEIPIRIDTAWNNVKTPALLLFVAKGMMKLKSVDGPFPKQWEAEKTYAIKTRVFGLIPFGGIHYLSIVKIDDNNFALSTKEWDSGAKVWNHNIIMRDLGDGKIYYEDSIVIYGGMMTGFITSFAKIFYKHRQKRWQIVAANKLEFGN